jgi:hypothetical protein
VSSGEGAPARTSSGGAPSNPSSPRHAALGAVAFAAGAERDPLGLMQRPAAARPAQPAAAARRGDAGGDAGRLMLASSGGSSDVELAAMSVLGHLALATALAKQPRSHPLGGARRPARASKLGKVAVAAAPPEAGGAPGGGNLGAKASGKFRAAGARAPERTIEVAL